MALRVLDVLLPSDRKGDFLSLVEDAGYEQPISIISGDGRVEFRLLVHAQHVGPLVDALEKRFGSVSGFHLLIMNVEAALPRRSRSDGDESAVAEDVEDEQPKLIGTTGVSRQELYAKVQAMIHLDRTFIATVILSTVVAAVGMLRDNMAVLIGAMVIAPLLGPNVALALATTLADTQLLRRSAFAGTVGITIAGAIAIVLGMLLRSDPMMVQIAGRTEVQLSDLVLALASGGAAVLALTRGVSSALVGVMVAVALLPPTVAVGFMIGAGKPVAMLNAGMLLLANIICVNLAGVVTFLLQGVRPLNWWEARRVRRSQRIALSSWLVLLVVLAVLIVASKRWL